MELEHLRYVIKLAKHKHFSNTAAELCITQPSLSQRISQIEKEFNIKLFERKTRSVVLTAAGEEFVMQAEKILASYAELKDIMHKYSSLKKKVFRVGILLNMARLNMRMHVFDFQKEYPHIMVIINEAVGSFELIKRLETEELDVVFFIPLPEMKLPNEIGTYSVLSGQAVAVVANNHRLASKNTVMVEDLKEEEMVFPSRMHSLFETFMEVCRKKGVNPKIVAQSTLVDTSIEMVKRNIGIAILSSPFISTLDCHGLKAIPIEPTIPRNIMMAFSRQNPDSSDIKLFKEFISTRLKEKY